MLRPDPDSAAGRRPAGGARACFLRLANLPNYALDRLSRYEVALWRQVAHTLVALDDLDRRKPQERRRRFVPDTTQRLTRSTAE